ncbi:hypothetical protein KBY57_02950 [Cyanobium sp. Aljojuca 7D2]|uniref:YrbL family protein n=1 Tax=Cyanobium sp. Aljojuca 7D2 TaxID=2823698 RepID=UPI0020CCF4D2|nr:YrbL family protein [Cyanobium sp. Aljojuca 7D2]MCP9890020.1 hypothetical protein [Cyanobium sp. Aljojuca 7D2]
MPKAMLQALAFLDISDLAIAKQGRMRNIRILPDPSNAVLKTIRPEITDQKGQFMDKNLLQRLRSHGCHSSTLREIEEYIIQCRRNHTKRGFSLPIAHVIGLLPTDEGLGLLAEKITDNHGNLAPTIAELIKQNKIRNKHVRALQHFRDGCIANHIVIGDLHANNIVYTETRSSKPECVCIDGYGEKALIPVHRWSNKLNEARINKKINRILNRISAESKTALLQPKL